MLGGSSDNYLPIVISNGDSSWLLANIDALAAVRDIALLRTSIVAGRGATRSLVGIASRAEINQAIRC